MAGVYSGNFADAKIIHPLDSEDADQVGPSAYTLQGAAAFSATSKFGSALSAPAAGDALDSDAGVAAIGNADTVRTAVHCFWRTTATAGVQVMFALMNAAKTAFMLRVLWDGGVGRLLAQWRRSTFFPSTANNVVEPEATGIVAKILLNVYHSLVFYTDAGSQFAGKIFLNGVDETTMINETLIGASANIATPLVTFGNDQTEATPARFVDEVTVVQSPLLNDAKLIRLVTNYDDTQGFGYLPTFTSTDVTAIRPGDAVVLTGTGYGVDVEIRVDGLLAPSIVRTSQSTVSFVVPQGIRSGLLDIAIKNVESDVTFTEIAALSNNATVWTSGGGSTRIIRFGDGIISGMAKVGDPVPFCDPNIAITDWTRISRAPD